MCKKNVPLLIPHRGAITLLLLLLKHHLRQSDDVISLCVHISDRYQYPHWVSYSTQWVCPDGWGPNTTQGWRCPRLYLLRHPHVSPLPKPPPNPPPPGSDSRDSWHTGVLPINRHWGEQCFSPSGLEIQCVVAWPHRLIQGQWVPAWFKPDHVYVVTCLCVCVCVCWNDSRPYCGSVF